MLLTPSHPPPNSGPSRPHLTPPQHSGHRLPTEITHQQQGPANIPGFTIPAVLLDSESISNTMAARLASSLISHILFLKSQIPFPVAQLSRLPAPPSASRTVKRHADLVTAMDTLSSHLITTFASLSTALALRILNQANDDSHAPPSPLAQAYMVIVLGPSVGSARARVLLALDGLEVKVWGHRGEAVPLVSCGHAKENTHICINPRDNEPGSEENVDEVDSENEWGDQESEQSHDGDTSFESSNSRESYALEPPPSRSPSPLPFATHAHTPSRTLDPARTPLSPLSVNSLQGSPIIQPQTKTYAEEQQDLRAADRLLSRTLASACAEDDGGLAGELAPTLTHVLLRAPRRFVHPAWEPRQNLTRSLEGILQTFSGNAVRDGNTTRSLPPKRPSRMGVKTEGVFVGCKAHYTVIPADNVQFADEEDEMIWWSWTEKIVGFSDW